MSREAVYTGVNTRARCCVISTINTLSIQQPCRGQKAKRVTQAGYRRVPGVSVTDASIRALARDRKQHGEDVI
jgi:hypothetical protein